MTGRSWRLGRRMAALFFLLLFSLPASALDHDADRLARELISSSPTARAAALAAIEARGGTDLVAPMIQALRFLRSSGGGVGALLDRPTGEALGNDWHAWMLWQQRHPEVVPYDGFDGFKVDVLALIDPPSGCP